MGFAQRKIGISKEKLKLKNISNLEELQDMLGNEVIDKCFMEYVLLLIAKANMLDRLICDLNKMDDTDTISCKELKNKLG